MSVGVDADQNALSHMQSPHLTLNFPLMMHIKLLLYFHIPPFLSLNQSLYINFGAMSEKKPQLNEEAQDEPSSIEIVTVGIKHGHT